MSTTATTTPYTLDERGNALEELDVILAEQTALSVAYLTERDETS